MTKNITQPSTAESGCNINWDLVKEYLFYSSIVCSLLSFVGNILIILTVYLTKTLRTTTNYFIVNMAISDVFVPALDMLHNVLFISKDAPVVSQILGTTLCKITAFLFNTSYGVSMSSLVVITVHRFYAVAFPMMTAKLDGAKTRGIVLLCTWLGPIAVCCPFLYYYTYIPKTGLCYFNTSKYHFLIQNITVLVLFGALPFLFMLVLYPVIVVKLVRQKVPGNSSPHAQKRRKQNISLTKMFITIIVALLLTYGIYQVVYAINVFSLVSDWCFSSKILYTVYPFPNMFHVINPLIYFIFCSTYRQGIKHMFSSCCRQ